VHYPNHFCQLVVEKVLLFLYLVYYQAYRVAGIFERFGGKMVFGVGVLCASILTMMTPFAARTSLPLLIAVRIVVGIGEVGRPCFLYAWK